MLELLLDFLMRTAEEMSDRRSKQHFIGEERLQVWRLFKPFMLRNIRAAFGAEDKGHVLLREAGAFPIRSYVVGQF